MKITPYHAKFYAYELTRVGGSGVDRLGRALFDACVELNPHQIEAALFALRSPLTKGVLLADEVGLGKTIEAALVLCQLWAERKRKLLVICPASLRKQWSLELAEKFNLPSVVLDAKTSKAMQKTGSPNPFRQESIIITSLHYAAAFADMIQAVEWDIIVIDEAHKLRNAHRESNHIGQTIRRATADRRKILLTATPLQNSLVELYGLSALIDDKLFGDLPSFRTQYMNSGGDLDGLRARLRSFCWRTLRRDVLEYVKYTERRLIISLNRQRDTADVSHPYRKFLLIEMGAHFDTVLVPRIKKVVYSPDWNEGKPTTRNKGITHAFKIIKLESYEDCLNNLILTRTEAQQDLLSQNSSIREDYLLGYFLNVETKGSILQLDRFTNPWRYQLNIATGNVGESKPTMVDLVETFNWLLGMQVDHISVIEHLRPDKGFKEDDNSRLQLASRHLRSAKPEEHTDCRSFQTVEGTLRTGEKTLIIWRSLSMPAKNQDASRALEEDNVMLEEFLSRKAINPREKQWDLIYVNGDHTVDNLAERLSIDAKSSGEAVHFKVRTIEPEFQRLMFQGTED